MKPLIQKLPLDEGSSFVARTYRTPYFETPWHQHEAIELVLCNGSNGTVFIGDYIGDYSKGEVYLLGKNLPHWFRKQNEDMQGEAVVIHFSEKMFGELFFQMPELKQIHHLLQTARNGLRLTGALEQRTKESIVDIEKQHGFIKLNSLLNCLHDISVSKSYAELSAKSTLTFSQQDQDRIGMVYDHAISHYRDNIKLAEMAELTNQSVSNFCRFFKMNTKKTFVQFLNEIRLHEASKLLKTTDKSITEICYDSGFRNWANFSTRFKKHYSMTPSAYRKKGETYK